MRELPLLDQPHTTCVRRVPIFARLAPDQQDAVGAFARPVTLGAGDVLHGAGEAVGQLFVVHAGSVKLVHTSPTGRTQLLRVAGAGEVVGEHGFLSGERPAYSVEAAEQTRLCVFAHDDLARLVATYPGISVGMLRALSERLADAERRLALAGQDVPARVAGYLLDLPGEASGGVLRVRLPWAKKDVASWLATTPESLSRALARLERRGLIAVDRDLVTVLAPDDLEAVAST